MASPTSPHSARLALPLAALGVVYGDIGTSPLYTLNTIFTAGIHPVPLTPENLLGILSLIFWSLVVVVCLKYVTFIMRADNHGEGGIMALLSLALSKLPQQGRYRRTMLLLGIFGAALFYGDGAITPAISVLSAVEGLQVASPLFKDVVIPLTLVIVVLLFLFQRKGTARVGALFGPVMLLWFSVIGLLGILEIAHNPQVLAALNPLHALRFFLRNHTIAFLALGGVVLSLTGAEALYADMGHFGRRPITLAWYGLVLPALLLNYYGQGALLLGNPKAIDNPFYLLAPAWALYPMILLSTAATVIASQSVISGAFSMTAQAIKLGYSPRMETLHTSESEKGQIYVPAINWALMLAVSALILGFQSSANLATAYGLAVSGTMLITTVLANIVFQRLWHWGLLRGGLLIAGLMTVDLSFFSANLAKISEGGWLPLAMGIGLFILMTTWKRGRTLLAARMRRESIGLDAFVASLATTSCARVPGTAIFLTANPEGVPHALLHTMKHMKTLHERIVILAVRTLEVPRTSEDRRMEVEALAHNFYRVTLRFGFMEEPNVPNVLFRQEVLPLQEMETVFILSRESLIPRVGSEMALWREKLFITLFRNAGSAIPYFKLPPNTVVEIGAQVLL
ncbi:MAG: potassium transporter Kup [Betaproteobacteria bacterium]|nr:potassium transporter Kup [Betaproteobacteria bacterium]MDE2623100.1 potassium transporter Kup [Betaproteobacteria bacterium]